MRQALGLAIALGACGSARIVSHTPAGGIVELQGDHNKAMEQAIHAMDAHCGFGGFTIKEGEDVTTRVHFACNTPAPTAGPAPRPPPPPPP